MTEEASSIDFWLALNNGVALVPRIPTMTAIIDIIPMINKPICQLKIKARMKPPIINNGVLIKTVANSKYVVCIFCASFVNLVINEVTENLSNSEKE